MFERAAMQTQFSRRTRVNIYRTVGLQCPGDINFMSKIFHSQHSMLPISAVMRIPLSAGEINFRFVRSVQHHLFRIEDATRHLHGFSIRAEIAEFMKPQLHKSLSDTIPPHDPICYHISSQFHGYFVPKIVDFR